MRRAQSFASRLTNKCCTAPLLGDGPERIEVGGDDGSPRHRLSQHDAEALAAGLRGHVHAQRAIEPGFVRIAYTSQEFEAFPQPLVGANGVECFSAVLLSVACDKEPCARECLMHNLRGLSDTVNPLRSSPIRPRNPMVGASGLPCHVGSAPRVGRNRIRCHWGWSGPPLAVQIVFGGLLCGLGDEDRFPQRRKVFAQVAGEQSERAWIWFDRGMECGHHGRRIMHDERLVLSEGVSGSCRCRMSKPPSRTHFLVVWPALRK